MYTPAVVEFLGTALVIGAMSFLNSGIMVVAATAIAIGLGGKISGGHFNPAVTAWSLLSGKISKQRAMTYTLAQLGAAVFIWVMGSFIRV